MSNNNNNENNVSSSIVSREKKTKDDCNNKRIIKRNQIQNITTSSDFLELQKAYQFVIPSSSTTQDDDTAPTTSTTWQDRMVQHYHSHLYKEYVLADMTRYKKNQIGMRWRTKQEVMDGKGFRTCGNKHCPSYQQQQSNPTHVETSDILSSSLSDYFKKTISTEIPSLEEELKLLKSVPEGVGLFDYEVHFSYQERGHMKSELVKLRLCLKCAPKLYFNRGGALKAREARNKVTKQQQHYDHCETVQTTNVQVHKQTKGSASLNNDDISKKRNISLSSSTTSNHSPHNNERNKTDRKHKKRKKSTKHY